MLAVLAVLISAAAHADTLPIFEPSKLKSVSDSDNDAAIYSRYDLDAVDPDAICNDGSSGVYYFRAGSGTGSTKWVLRLEGGGKLGIGRNQIVLK